MNVVVRTTILCAWAAVIAAWALPPKPAPAVMPNPNTESPRADNVPLASRDESSSSSAKLYGPGALLLTMQPADLWALATIRLKQLPPPQYDHPVKGPVEVTDIPTEEALRKICGYTQPGTILIGCAHVSAELCSVYLGPIPSWTGITRNINLRHELGHCNGWPGDHVGIR